LNPKNSTVPIIVIITQVSLKKIKTIDKNCWTVVIPPPTKKELCIYLSSVLKKNKLSFQNTDNSMDAIIQHSNGDFRQTYFIIRDIVDNVEKPHKTRITKVSHEFIQKILMTYIKKKTDCSLFDLFENIMRSDMTIHEKCKMAESDKTMTNLMFSENYPRLVDKNDFFLITDTADSISEANVIDKYINDTQDYSMNELSSFIGFIYSSGMIKEKQKLVDNFNKIAYPANLNKYAFQVSRKRKLIPFFRTCRISFEHLKLISSIIQSGNCNRAVEILKAYDIDIAQIETIVRISNLDKQVKINSKTKKDLKKTFNLN